MVLKTEDFTMKKLLALLLVVLMAVSLIGCTEEQDMNLEIGIVQLVQHEALDQAALGFQDELTALLADTDYTVTFDVQNASGDAANAATIATKFVNDNVDLILAIATPAAQAAAQATTEIPILVTAVTDPESANLVNSNEAPGVNVSGTSDMNPVDLQAELIQTLVPDAKNVGIMYCSAEDNSILQAELAQAALENLGFNVTVATAADSNEIQSVTTKLVGEVDAIYIPTDNTFAAAMPTVAMVAEPAGIPVIPGEEHMAKAGGLATYSINYYNLGAMTAKQAVQILVEGADITTMPIAYSATEDLNLYINEEVAEILEIEIPEELK